MMKKAQSNVRMSVSHVMQARRNQIAVLLQAKYQKLCDSERLTIKDIPSMTKSVYAVSSDDCKQVQADCVADTSQEA
jgi:hypothetical protein